MERSRLWWQTNRELSATHLHTQHVMLHCIDFGNRCSGGRRSRLRVKMGFWSIQALTFLAWLLQRSCFISPLYWGRNCINRHTGNRPSLSEEPLRRGPGPIARFPTLRYRPKSCRHLDCNDVLWNPFTFWEEVVVNSSFKSFKWAQLPYLTVVFLTAKSDALKLFFCFFKFFLPQPNLCSFTIHLVFYASFIVCHDVHSSYSQQCVQFCFSWSSPSLFWLMLSRLSCTWMDMFSPKASLFLTRR